MGSGPYSLYKISVFTKQWQENVKLLIFIQENNSQYESICYEVLENFLSPGPVFIVVIVTVFMLSATDSSAGRCPFSRWCNLYPECVCY